jgi:hypothetical protein
MFTRDHESRPDGREDRQFSIVIRIQGPQNDCFAGIEAG